MLKVAHPSFACRLIELISMQHIYSGKNNTFLRISFCGLSKTLCHFRNVWVHTGRG